MPFDTPSPVGGPADGLAAASALRAIAQKALKRGTGARGLRAILEELLTDVMFDLPTREDVVEVKITEPSVLNGTAPLLELAPTKRKKEA